MSTTGTSTQKVYERVLKDLNESDVLKRRLRTRVFDSGKPGLLPSEMPGGILEYANVGSKVVSDYPYIEELTTTWMLTIYLEAWNPEKSDFGGFLSGRGLIQFAQDVKQAFKDDLFINGLVQTLAFGEVEVFDAKEYPARAVRIPIITKHIEAMRSRESAVGS